MIIVNTATQQIRFGSGNDRVKAPCLIGRDGYTPQALGTEGDHKTPLGTYGLRFGLFRADRLPMPKSKLNFIALREDDGWCDDCDDPAYNRFVRLPYPARHENLFKIEGVYDIVIVLGHNDTPPRAPLGSAIFIHIARPSHRPTAGCIALEPEIMVQLLPFLTPKTLIKIQN